MRKVNGAKKNVAKFLILLKLGFYFYCQMPHKTSVIFFFFQTVYVEYKL